MYKNNCSLAQLKEMLTNCIYSNNIVLGSGQFMIIQSSVDEKVIRYLK